MIGKIVATLLGEAGIGQRKFIIGMVGMTMLFVVAMWWPISDVAEKGRIASDCIDSIVVVIGLIAGTILGERFGQTKP